MTPTIARRETDKEDPLARARRRLDRIPEEEMERAGGEVVPEGLMERVRERERGPGRIQ